IRQPVEKIGPPQRPIDGGELGRRLAASMRMAYQLPDLDPGTVLHGSVVEVNLEPVPDHDGRTGKSKDVLHSADALPVAEAVKESAEDTAFAGERRTRRGRDGALTGDGLVVVGAGNRVDGLSLVEVLGAFDLGHEADEHAVAHDLGLQAGRAVGVPLGLATAGQRHADAELAYAAAEQVRVDAAVTQGVDHAAGAEFVHAGNDSARSWKLAERSLQPGSPLRADRRVARRK